MKIRDYLLPGLLGVAIIFCQCQIKPADPGVAAPNLSPTTFLPNVPLDSSTSNPYKMRLQWHGNDADGIITGYEYKIDGPLHKAPAYRLFKNNWIFTENHFDDFKFQNGWYRLWVRSVDEKGAIDETPDSLTFHVTGPTFDRGILLVDDDATGTKEDNDSDRNKDIAYANLLTEAGFPRFTVWDHEAMFGLTGKPVFVDSAIDSTGNKYYGMSAYSTIIWYTGHDSKDHIYKLEKFFIDYLEMGGNLWISGIQPMFSITGDQPTGVRFSESSFARKYLHIQSADSVANEVDILLSAADRYPDLPTSVDVSTILRIFAGHYNWTIGSSSYSISGFNQLVPEPDADALYLFSKNVYESVQQGVTHYINAEEFANTPCAVRYRGTNYNAITFGFPLIRVERRKDVFDHAAMVEITRQILAEEFLERP